MYPYSTPCTTYLQYLYFKFWVAIYWWLQPRYSKNLKSSQHWMPFKCSRLWRYFMVWKSVYFAQFRVRNEPSVLSLGTWHQIEQHCIELKDLTFLDALWRFALDYWCSPSQFTAAAIFTHKTVSATLVIWLNWCTIPSLSLFSFIWRHRSH